VRLLTAAERYWLEIAERGNGACVPGGLMVPMAGEVILDRLQTDARVHWVPCGCGKHEVAVLTPEGREALAIARMLDTKVAS
jgi:hypothetical protein